MHDVCVCVCVFESLSLCVLVRAYRRVFDALRVMRVSGAANLRAGLRTAFWTRVWGRAGAGREQSG